MGLEAFNPGRIWTWPELDEMTGKKPGLWTWMFKVSGELPQHGYEVKFITEIDIVAFAQDAKAYIHTFFSKEGALAQIEHADIEAEQHYAARLAANTQDIHFENRQFTLQDIKNLISDGYMIVPQINPYKLDDEEGYAGHSILIYAIEGEDGIYHDSGLEGAQAAKRRPLAKFVEAALDNGKMEGLLAFRPKTTETQKPTPSPAPNTEHRTRKH